jgi:hypothetical protein
VKVTGPKVRVPEDCELPLLPQPRISWFVVVGFQHCTKEEVGEGRSDRGLEARPDAIRNPPTIMTGVVYSLLVRRALDLSLLRARARCFEPYVT